MIRESSIPSLAALLFGAFVALAGASQHTVLARLAEEAGIDEWALVAVPALLAMLCALIVYRRAVDRVKNIGQSLSRGLLVALLTWVSFSALVSWGWCIPTLFAACMTKAMMISGALGGGQLLLASLVAAAIMGYVIRGLTSGTRKAKD
jgi:hypothetical protein